MLGTVSRRSPEILTFRSQFISHPERESAGGFCERPQTPYGLSFDPEEVPTETEAFCAGAACTSAKAPTGTSFSNGKVSRTMINVSKAHWRVTAARNGKPPARASFRCSTEVGPTGRCRSHGRPQLSFPWRVAPC